VPVPDPDVAEFHVHATSIYDAEHFKPQPANGVSMWKLKQQESYNRKQYRKIKTIVDY